MCKMKFALVALLFLPLAACSNSQEELSGDEEDVVLQYRGEDIHCLTTGSYRSATLSCDYERFYNENPLLAR